MQALPLFFASRRRRLLLPLAAVALLGLSGCVAYPAAPGYAYDGGGYYAPGYYYAPYAPYAPPVVVDFGWWGGGHWDGGGRWGGGHWGGGWRR